MSGIFPLQAWNLFPQENVERRVATTPVCGTEPESALATKHAELFLNI